MSSIMVITAKLFMRSSVINAGEFQSFLPEAHVWWYRNCNQWSFYLSQAGKYIII